MSISYPLELLQNPISTKLAIKQTTTLDDSQRAKYNLCFAQVDGNEDGQVGSQEWTAAKTSDNFKKFCEDQGISFQQVACRMDALFNPIAKSEYSFTSGTAQVKHVGTEYLVLFDLNGDGVFDPTIGDSMELIAPNYAGCWICMVGIPNASDPLVAIVKSQEGYVGRTVQEITAIVETFLK